MRPIVEFGQEDKPIASGPMEIGVPFCLGIRAQERVRALPDQMALTRSPHRRSRSTRDRCLREGWARARRHCRAGAQRRLACHPPTNAASKLCGGRGEPGKEFVLHAIDADQGMIVAVGNKSETLAVGRPLQVASLPRSKNSFLAACLCRQAALSTPECSAM